MQGGERLIGRVKTKPLICVGISKAKEKSVSPDSMGWLCQCMCRVRVVSDSCSLVRISNLWCCMSKTSWPTVPDWSNKYSFYNCHTIKHTAATTTLMCCHWGKGQTLQSQFKNPLGLWPWLSDNTILCPITMMDKALFTEGQALRWQQVVCHREKRWQTEASVLI